MKIDEEKYLKSLFPQLTGDSEIIIPPGDDCAGLKLSDDSILLLTVDQLAENVHYCSKDSAEPTCPKKAGRKLLARSISDIAAMAGRPLYALLAVSMSPEYSQEWLNEFTLGILDLAEDYNIHIIGGDLASANTNVASLTLLGMVSTKQVCKRNQANAGDVIFVTGEFGGSLETGKHLDFQPRLDEALWLAENDFTNTIIDISDGLIQDLVRLCNASSVSAVIDENNIPRSKINDLELPLKNAYLDGEDYELLFAVPERRKYELIDQWPFNVRLTHIGQLIEIETEISIVTNHGNNVTPLVEDSFDHFEVQP